MAKKKKKGQGFNSSEKLRKVKILYSTGRKKESIAYLYAIYTAIAAQRYGERKTPSQTIRDFAIVMVKKYKQDPQNIYPFIQSVEKTIYGGFPTTEQAFQNIISSFSKLHLELTGKPMPKF